MGFFGFGKKKRTTRRKTVSKKPPARLLRICKKYRVKATRKVGGKRVYKSIKVLKKLCLKKAMALKKKLMKMKKSKKSKKTTRRRRKSRFGMEDEDEEMSFGRSRKNRFGMYDEDEDMSFGRRRSRFGSKPIPKPLTPPTPEQIAARMAAEAHGAQLKAMDEAKNQQMARVGEAMRTFVDECGARNGKYMPPSCTTSLRFGKRRRVGAKASRKTAMKAFSAFFKRHCAGRRGSRFGSGGNPPLSASMGYEFCPNGMGGVLGANSTGLFPSPCIGSAPMTGRSSSFGGYSMFPQFGRRRAASAIGSKGRSRTKIGSRRRNAAGGCGKDRMSVGSKKKYAKKSKSRKSIAPKKRRKSRKSMFGF